MGSFTDKDSSTDTAGSPLESAGPLPDTSRRRFSRSAIAGSAVLLSLGNRAAWGAQVGCMSVATLNSFNPAPTGGTGTFMSAPGARPDHQNLNLAQKIHDISNPPTYIGSSGSGTNKVCTVQETASFDRVCYRNNKNPTPKCP